MEFRHKVTKEFILERISQERIFEQYLQISIPDDSTTRICSPLRSDKNPTVSFKYDKSGKLKMKDWSGQFWGDCFDVVGFMIGENSNSKDGFINILTDIARRNNFLSFTGEYTIVTPKNYENLKKVKERVVIEFNRRPFDVNDARYWLQFKITSKQYLTDNFCFPVQEAFTYYNNIPNRIYCYSGDSDICYAYFQGRDEKNNSICQLYFPNRTHDRRWKTTHYRLFGMLQLLPNEICVITKSYKDVLVLRKLVALANLPITVICVPAENYLMSKSEYDIIKRNHDLIVTLFDFDFAGRNLAYKYKTVYNCPTLFLTNGKRGTKYNYKAKDISAYCAANSTENAVELVEKTYNYLKTKYL